MWDSVRFGQFTFSRRRRELRRSGSIVRIPNKALEALDLLLSSPGATISKAHLYEALWGEKAVDGANLPQAIYCLRKALACGDGASAIKTVPGVGYAFVENVTVCPPDLGSIPVQALVAITPYTNPEAASLATARRLLQRGRHADTRAFLEPMASKHLDAGSAATFFSLRARARMDAGDEARARDDVREAVRIAKSPEGASSVTALEASMAQAYLVYRKGQYPAAVEIARGAVDTLPTRSMGPTQARLLAQALIDLLRKTRTRRDPRRAGASRARRCRASRASRTAGRRSLPKFSFNRHSVTPRRRATSRARSPTRARRSSSRSGISSTTSKSGRIFLAIIGHCAGTLPEAQRHAQSALALARLSLDGRPTGPRLLYRIANRNRTRQRCRGARAPPRSVADRGTRSADAREFFTSARLERNALSATNAVRRSPRRTRSIRSNGTARRPISESPISRERGRGAGRERKLPSATSSTRSSVCDAAGFSQISPDRCSCRTNDRKHIAASRGTRARGFVGPRALTRDDRYARF